MSKNGPVIFDEALALPADRREQLVEALRESLNPPAGEIELERLPDDIETHTFALSATVADAEIVIVGTPVVGPLGSTVEESFGWLAFKFVAGHAAGAVVGKVADIGFGFVLKLFGYESPDDKILAKLKELDAKLDKISGLIESLSKQIVDLLAALNMAADKIISEANALEIKRSVEAITFAYHRLTTQFKPEASGAHTKSGRKAASEFAREVLRGDHGIGSQLWSVHTSIMGASPGTTGVLDAMTKLLIDRVNAGHDLYDAYQALEGYFGQFLAIEAKGLTLIIEAMNQTAPLPGEAAAASTPHVESAAGHPGTAKEYWETNFTPMIEEQVDEFLNCVDLLVLSQASVRTNLARPVPLFPHLEKVERIYARADFMAAQVAPGKHPAGVIARLVGEPGNIELAVQQQAISYGEQKLTAVRVDGETINYYEPTWPADFTIKRYLEWQWVPDETFDLYGVRRFVPDDHRRFVPADRIAVVKLHCPAPPADIGHGGTVQVIHEHGQEVGLAYRDDYFKEVATPGSNDVPYGHVLFTIRHAPRFLDLGFTVWENQGGWNVQAQRDVATMTQGVRASVVPQKCDQRLAVSAKGGFFVPVVNGTDEPLTLGVVWTCVGAYSDVTRFSMVWWLSGCVTAETCLNVTSPGATTVPSPTGRWHVPDSPNWESRADSLRFSARQAQLFDLTTVLQTGTFLYRFTPTQSKFRLKCRLPHSAAAAVSVELKSLELLLR